MKSVCTIAIDTSYDVSVARCNTYGMKSLRARTDEEKNAILRYSDVKFPYGSFWIEGKSGTMCNVLTNNERPSYEEVQVLCTSFTLTYHYCEYACMNYWWLNC